MLFLIPALLLVAFCLFTRRLVNRGITKSLFLNLSFVKKWLGLIFLAVSLCLAVVAADRPTLVFKDGSYNLMVLLDISLSMYCQDYNVDGQAVSRLEMAKANLAGLLDELPPGSRMGMAVLAGYTLYADPAIYGIDDVPSGGVPQQPFLRQANFGLVQEALPVIRGSEQVNTFLVPLVPPLDVRSAYSELYQMIESIGPVWIWEGGSPITSALIRMGFLMRTNPNIYGKTVLILLTDGEEKELIAPPEKLDGQELGQNKLVVCSLGFDKPMPVPEYDINTGQFKGYREKYGAKGEFITSLADEKFMIELAEIFKAPYLKIKDVSDLKSLVHHRADLKTGEGDTAKDISWLVWLASAIFFIVSFVV